ncbi:hypothetical protein SNEBB_009480 [Seison nebaliae]|nr:hypothetical protein SNEBB_009480 [Seison nebaliae]
MVQGRVKFCYIEFNHKLYGDYCEPGNDVFCKSINGKADGCSAICPRSSLKDSTPSVPIPMEGDYCCDKNYCNSAQQYRFGYTTLLLSVYFARRIFI